MGQAGSSQHRHPLLQLAKRSHSTGPVRITMVGLDDAGGTTCMERLAQDTGVELNQTEPTKYFPLWELSHGNVSLVRFRVGGSMKIRPQCRHIIEGMSGDKTRRAVIFVVNCAEDRARMDEARDELEKMLQEVPLHNAPLLVLSNKSDLTNMRTAAEVVDVLALNSLRDRKWFIQSCCAATGDGLMEGLDWLRAALAR